MNQAQIFQLIVSVLTVLASGASAFYGVKVSVARVEEQISAQGRELDEMRRRLDRIEQPHFGRGKN